MNDHRENKSTLCLIYTTLPSLEAAEDMAHRLITEKLAACVNIFPQIRSIYRWEHQIQKNDEASMIIKTTQHKKAALIKWLEEHHPYDTPAILHQEIETSEKFFTYVSSAV